MRLVLVLALLTLPFLTVCGLPVTQKNSLESLYTSTNGGSWITKTNWNSGDPCGPPAWYGIVCDVNLTTVLSIELPENNLVGIPSNLNLPQLSRL